METRLKQILTHEYKADMIAHLAAHHEDFDEAIQLAVSDKQPYSWRAAWLLWSCMEENDRVFCKYLTVFWVFTIRINIFRTILSNKDSIKENSEIILKTLRDNGALKSGEIAEKTGLLLQFSSFSLAGLISVSLFLYLTCTV